MLENADGARGLGFAGQLRPWWCIPPGAWPPRVAPFTYFSGCAMKVFWHASQQK